MNLIVSVSSDWAIGFNNDLLFHVSEDMKYFKRMTIGHVVVMGQNTFLSLPGQKPLRERVNIVLSNDPSFSGEGTITVHSLDELFSVLKQYDDNDIFIIGGAMMYETMLPHCSKAYITQFYASREADRFFPRLDQSPEWALTQRSEKNESDDLAFTFDVYERV